MATSIAPVRVNHLNAVIEDFDLGMKYFSEVYGSEFLIDLPAPEMHAAVIGAGRVLFEFFAPRIWLLNSRYGPHYLGIEYQADLEVARKAVAERGIRIARDIKLAIHTDPRDAFGVSFEFYDGFFHDNPPLLGGKIMKDAAYWRDEHPLGLTGLKAYTVVVKDADEASAFFQSFLSGRPVYDEARPAIGARAVGLQVADAVMEILAPTSGGAARDHLERYGQGIGSTVFGVRDLDQAKRYFADRGVQTEAGWSPDRFQVPAHANSGVIFEFAA